MLPRAHRSASLRWLAVLAFSGALAACGASADPSGGDDDDDDDAQPDAGVVPAPFERGQAGGMPTAIDVVGDVAYVAIGPRLTIWSLSGTTPRRLGETVPLAGRLDAVAVLGERAFVAEAVELSSRIRVFDVSDPAAPIETAVLELDREGPSTARALVATGDRLFVADQRSGLIEIDVATPDAPREVRRRSRVGLFGLARVGDRLYYAADVSSGMLRLGAYDLTDALRELGEVEIEDGLAVAFAGGDRAVVAETDGTVLVLDLADPGELVETWRDDSLVVTWSPALVGAASAAWLPSDDGLRAVDLRGAIAMGAPIALAGLPVAADVDGDRLVLADDRGGLAVFDVRAPNRPALDATADVSLCASCTGVATTATSIVTSDRGGRLRTAGLDDLTLTGAAEPAAQAEPPPLPHLMLDVQTFEGRAYLVDQMLGVRIFDLRAGGPAEGSPVALPGGAVAMAIDPVIGVGLVATSTGTLYALELPGGDVIDDLEVPDAVAVAVDPDAELAYVAGGTDELAEGVSIVDTTIEDHLAVVGRYDDGCHRALAVAAHGGLMIVACGYDGFHLVDVSDPTRPVRVGAIGAPGGAGATAVAVSEGRAWLGHRGGVVAIDLADPAAPTELASFATAASVEALAVPVAGRVVAACGAAGIYQFHVAAE